MNTKLAFGLFVFTLAAGPSAYTGRADNLLDHFLAGPMKGVDGIVFAVRQPGKDGHWYANFSYYAADANRKAYGDGGRLCRLNRAGEVTVLLDDPKGGVRDPQVNYDATKIIFSYRRGGTPNYLLYEINPDGTALKQLTSGDYDDIEPACLPDGSIVFVSSRCKRWVNCWLTQVAILHRCDADGKNVRPLSSNNEQDNTPWPLPDGRILYTRWEYVDRSQVDYHHLWTINPDGSGQMVYYGNLHPSTVMIDAKPIPNSDKIVASFSPGHGIREHDGVITVVDPKAGPDDTASARRISQDGWFRDPWAFSEDCFLAAQGSTLVVMDGHGNKQVIHALSAADRAAGLECHEPRPLTPRPREKLVEPRINLAQSTGRLMVANVHEGRNMTGVKPGDIKRLLVLETLPMPIHYTGGMEPISYGGTFTLERIVGTVPVESDGSAFFELPALRSFFFVALDEHDLAVKRMQSFVTVQPGETTGCVGCHEQRTHSPGLATQTMLAVRRPPSPIAPIAGVPEVLDFPRDIQPILDALCVDCHGYEKTPAGGPRAGRLILAGDAGPLFSHSYYMMTIAGLFSDGRNIPRSNYAPRTLGSSASRILKMLDGTHYNVRATPEQKRTLRLWIETGAAFPGTYAALGTGMIGNYDENQEINTDTEWPTTKAGAAVLARRCAACHTEPARLLPTSLADERGVSFWQPELNDPRLNTSRHIVFNLSRPEKSLMVLAPLAPAAGGWGLCRDPKSHQPASVFADAQDPDYQVLLAMCAAGRDHLARIKRFDMPDFRPRADWVRELKRYGILPAEFHPGDAVDVYATEQRYWKSLWYQPVAPSPAYAGNP
ncbi:MAG: hypothetical protein ABSC03_04815 [Verrucomicrobiota bacterium]|jgi:cytochrome c553